MTGSKESGERPRILLVNRCIVLNGEGKILLIRRSQDDSWAPGMWEFPGGKLDQGQDVSHALEREVLEETGLFITPADRVAFVDSGIVTTAGRYYGMTYIALIGVGKLEGGKLQLSSEHDAHQWLTPDEALELGPSKLKDESYKALVVLRGRLS